MNTVGREEPNHGSSSQPFFFNVPLRLDNNNEFDVRSPLKSSAISEIAKGLAKEAVPICWI